MRAIPSLAACVAALGLAFGGGAQGGAAPTASPVLDKFLALDHVPPSQYRALRHFDASSRRMKSVAWMDVWTETDERGFRYEIASEGGSSYIRSRVFRGTLETEQRQWDSRAPDRAAVARRATFAAPPSLS